MRILITGACGFVGRALTERLHPAHEVVAFDRVRPVLTGVDCIEGDLRDARLVDELVGRCDAIVHLATMPGGAAEATPAEAWQVNVEASVRLIDAAAATGRCPRFVCASSIAAIGVEPRAPVDDTTPLRPTMLYGAHKTLVEQWLAMRSRRGEVDGISLRLPGIVARLPQAAGFGSAFLSDIFHAAAHDRSITLPVSGGATTWLASLGRVAANLQHAIESAMPAEEPFACTLPALRVEMGALVAELVAQCGWSSGKVSYAPDPAVEAAFGRLPALRTERAERWGFSADASLADLVRATLAQLKKDAP